MRAADFLSAFGLILALASSFATAYDPSPLQDFCVAANDTNSAVFVNGEFCKNPSDATINDFLFSGLDVPRDTSNQLGVNITFVDVGMIPGLNTQGLTLARLDFAPNGGLNPPHYHPRASEILLVLEGTLYAGFVTSNPDHRFFSKVLHPGDVIVFPLGLIHFQRNIGSTSAVAVATLSSQNPGVVTVANALFGANPAISPGVLAKALHLKRCEVESLQEQTWPNPS